MFRNDFLWLLPCLVVALYQVKIIWGKLPLFDDKDTAIKGQYDIFDKFKLSYLQGLTKVFFGLQLVFSFLPITDSAASSDIRKIGYFLVILGLIISLFALKTLGKNWTGMNDYRIVKDQKLVTKGIYSLIRHPIYLAVILESVGFELVANSWFFIPVLIVSFIVFTSHIDKEEILLKVGFGKEFAAYKTRSKKLIPFIY
jgi:protein-S-isoprenylcysteine O-methyltransferase Ste14